MKLVCTSCGAHYPIDSARYICDCKGLFQLEYEKKPLDFMALKRVPERSIWRYRDALPPIAFQSVAETSMGEGGTPLISLGSHVQGKADFLMPTLSFKDRGGVVLAAAMHELHIRSCVIDSSGNAATSLAAYCARTDIACDVFVPAHTSEKKIEQIHAHGATVHRVAGSREDTASAAREYVKRTVSFYASHIYNPLFIEGTKTYIHELFEQCGALLPDVLISPVGNGTLLLGIALALKELFSWGYISGFPRVLAIQAANCAPLADAYERGALDIQELVTTPTLAEGIASAKPARAREILSEMRSLNGTFITVTEESILEARDELARRGLYVELTSAANWAGYRAALAAGLIAADDRTVIPLCGAGLKSAH